MGTYPTDSASMPSWIAIARNACWMIAFWVLGASAAAAEPEEEPHPSPIKVGLTAPSIPVPSIPIAPPGTSAPGDAPTPGRPVITASRAEGPIKIDGALDEPAWAKAQAISGFRQMDPKEGEPATDETTVRVLFTEDALYFGVECRSHDPSTISASQVQRDYDINNPRDDLFGITLDTHCDRRNAFVFIVNPLGTQCDMLVTDEGNDVNLQWDGVWQSAARMTADGWTAEIRIPLSTLRFHPHPKHFGINFTRYVPAKKEETLWTAWARAFGPMRISECGDLVGIDSLIPQRPLVFKPYALAGVDRNVPAPDTGVPQSDVRRNVGADLKVGLTGGLTADITANTDFSQVDADNQQINLGRFNLFFPEKREFFLEGAGIFQTAGGGSGGPTLFYSRQIGLTPAGRPIPVLGGLRVTGREGPTTLGILDIATEATGDQPRLNFSVVRAKMDVLEHSYVGFLGIDRTTLPCPDRPGGCPSGSLNPALVNRNGLAEVDTDLKLGRYWEAYGQAAKTHTSGLEGANSFEHLGAYYNDDDHTAVLDWQEIERNFDPEVGYMQRNPYRSVTLVGEWRPRPDWPTVRNLAITPIFQQFLNPDGSHALQTEYDLVNFRLVHQDGAYWFFSPTRVRDVPSASFTPVPTVVVPAGAYEFYRYQLMYGTDPSEPISGSLSAQWGTYYGGVLNEVTPHVEFHFSPRWAVTLDDDWNDAHLPLGNFQTNLMRARLDLNVSRTLYSSLFVQVNSLTGHGAGGAFPGGTAAFRVRWRYRDNSDFFFVVNYDTPQPGPGPVFPALTAARPALSIDLKLTYAFMR